MIFQMKISIWPYRMQKPKVFRWHGPIKLLSTGLFSTSICTKGLFTGASTRDAAKARVRKATLELAKLGKEYRKTSI